MAYLPSQCLFCKITNWMNVFDQMVKRILNVRKWNKSLQASPLCCHQTSYVLHLILEYVIGEGRKKKLLKFQMLTKQGTSMAKNQPQATYYSLGVVP
jgi:hypothetical protein